MLNDILYDLLHETLYEMVHKTFNETLHEAELVRLRLLLQNHCCSVSQYDFTEFVPVDHFVENCLVMRV